MGDFKTLDDICIDIVIYTKSSGYLTYLKNTEHKSIRYSQISGSFESDLISFDVFADKTTLIKNQTLLKNKRIHTLLITRVDLSTDDNGLFILTNPEITDDLKEDLYPYFKIERLTKDISQIQTTGTGDNFIKNLFMVNISHEIRTPLNGIIGYGQLLMQTELNTLQKGYLASVNNCGVQLLQIINDILDFTKLSCGKMTVSEECCRIKKILKSSIEPLNQKFKEKKQICSYEISGDVPECLITDSYKIIQILVNLLSNCNKYCDNHCEILIHVRKEVDDLLIIKVSDNGPGISDNDIYRVFNAFTQLGTNQYDNKGTGLGLSICKKLTELLGGKIYICKSNKQGLEIEFSVRYKKYDESRLEQILPEVSFAGKKVLVVDDNENNRIILSDQLFGWGIDVITCSSALEALSLIIGNRHDFDIALIDICMPRISGIELAKKIKEEKPNLLLIAISSVDEEQFDCRHFESTMKKPISKNKLYDNIKKVLEINDISNLKLCDISHPVKKKRILIAEDNEINTQLLQSLLKNEDLTMTSNGRMAIEKLEKESFDLLILDLKMPVLDGFAVLEWIAQKQVRLNTIVLTASIVDEDKEMCKKMGVNYYVSKPIDTKQFLKIIVEIFKNKI